MDNKACAVQRNNLILTEYTYIACWFRKKVKNYNFIPNRVEDIQNIIRYSDMVYPKFSYVGMHMCKAENIVKPSPPNSILKRITQLV